MKKFSKGFTLIELLVVIAIIGLLAAIVLASLNTARQKGADAAVKANMANIRAQAEIQYDLPGLGCYTITGGTCNATNPAVPTAGATSCTTGGVATIFLQPTIASQLAGAKSAGGGRQSCMSTVGGTAWAAVTQMKSDPTLGWCVDSTGKSSQVAIGGTQSQAAFDTEVAGGVCA